jgi:uncharacterized protein YodC (DUF2158 family)
MEIVDQGHGMPPRMRFSVGDVVQLKSGGPVMTVTDINNVTVDVTWFSGTKICTNEFDDAALEMSEKPTIIVKSQKKEKKAIAQTEDALLV